MLDHAYTNFLSVLHHFHHSHEMAETYFIMWRLTHSSEYRDAAWDLAQAING